MRHSWAAQKQNMHKPTRKVRYEAKGGASGKAVVQGNPWTAQRRQGSRHGGSERQTRDVCRAEIHEASESTAPRSTPMTPWPMTSSDCNVATCTRSSTRAETYVRGQRARQRHGELLEPAQARPEWNLCQRGTVPPSRYIDEQSVPLTTIARPRTIR
jgi:hypothetical protein